MITLWPIRQAVPLLIYCLTVKASRPIKQKDITLSHSSERKGELGFLVAECVYLEEHS
jgi:hypothetical protein